MEFWSRVRRSDKAVLKTLLEWKLTIRVRWSAWLNFEVNLWVLRIWGIVWWICCLSSIWNRRPIRLVCLLTSWEIPKIKMVFRHLNGQPKFAFSNLPPFDEIKNGSNWQWNNENDPGGGTSNQDLRVESVVCVGIYFDWVQHSKFNLIKVKAHWTRGVFYRISIDDSGDFSG